MPSRPYFLWVSKNLRENPCVEESNANYQGGLHKQAIHAELFW